jgi:hypothetical protein
MVGHKSATMKNEGGGVTGLKPGGLCNHTCISIDQIKSERESPAVYLPSSQIFNMDVFNII